MKLSLPKRSASKYRHSDRLPADMQWQMLRRDQYLHMHMREELEGLTCYRPCFRSGFFSPLPLVVNTYHRMSYDWNPASPIRLSRPPSSSYSEGGSTPKLQGFCGELFCRCGRQRTINGYVVWQLTRMLSYVASGNRLDSSWNWNNTTCKRNAAPMPRPVDGPIPEGGFMLEPVSTARYF